MMKKTRQTNVRSDEIDIDEPHNRASIKEPHFQHNTTPKTTKGVFVYFKKKHFFYSIGTGQQYKRVKKTFKSKKVKE